MKYLKFIVVILVFISLSGCLSSEQTETTTTEDESKEITDSQILETFLSQLDTEPLEADVYYVFIINENYDIVKTYRYYETGKKRIEWPGRDENDNLCPDGLYHVILYNTRGSSELVVNIKIQPSDEEEQGQKTN